MAWRLSISYSLFALCFFSILLSLSFIICNDCGQYVKGLSELVSGSDNLFNMGGGSSDL